MPVKVIILLAYGAGLVMGFVVARLYPKRTSESDSRCWALGFFICIIEFVIGYVLGLLAGLI